jgi:hypothetical protein
MEVKDNFTEVVTLLVVTQVVLVEQVMDLEQEQVEMDLHG